MSLLNVIRHSNAVHIVTDGAALDDNAFVAAFVPKVICLPHLSAAIAFRGDMMVGQYIGNLLTLGSNKFRTFDQLKTSIAHYTRDLLDALAKDGHFPKGDPRIEMEVAVGGWSDSAGPAAYYFHTSKKSPLGAWRIQDQDIVRLSPIKKDDQVCLSLLADEGQLTDQRIVEAATRQRRYVERIGPRKILSPIVGGFLQVTTVTQQEIRTRIIHRWPDKIGDQLGMELEHAA